MSLPYARGPGLSLLRLSSSMSMFAQPPDSSLMNRYHDATDEDDDREAAAYKGFVSCSA